LRVRSSILGGQRNDRGQPRQHILHIARILARDDHAVVLFVPRHQPPVAVKDQPPRGRDQPDVDAVFLGQQAEFVGLLDLHVAHARAQHGDEGQLRCPQHQRPARHLARAGFGIAGRPPHSRLP
jgi:hypothetical protein